MLRSLTRGGENLYAGRVGTCRWVARDGKTVGIRFGSCSAYPTYTVPSDAVALA